MQQAAIPGLASTLSNRRRIFENHRGLRLNFSKIGTEAESLVELWQYIIFRVVPQNFVLG